MAAPPKVVVAQVETPVELAPNTIKAIAPQKRQGRKQSESTQALDDELALKTKGQRRVNLIWEYTQAAIALLSVTTLLAIALVYAVTGSDREIPLVLQNMIFLIIGAYFSRTNHEKIGGVGSKESRTYEGR